MILAIALNPAYERLVATLGGRRRLASAVLTLICKAIIVGPALWLVFRIIGSLRLLSEWFDPKALSVPPPPAWLQSWPLIGEPAYQFWMVASANLHAAFLQIAPQLKSAAAGLLQVAASAGAGTLRIFVAIIVAGFLFAPASAQVDATEKIARRLAPDRGDKFVGMTGAGTIHALLFTLYMIPISFVDNLLKPLVMTRGLSTPIVIILIGVIGGTISYGVTGLFLGPIVLAVMWELFSTWTQSGESIPPAFLIETAGASGS